LTSYSVDDSKAHGKVKEELVIIPSSKLTFTVLRFSVLRWGSPSFTQRQILQQIGWRLLEALLYLPREFGNRTLYPDNAESQNGSYFDSLAATLGSDVKLPDRLRTTLLALETTALPENDKQLDAALLTLPLFYLSYLMRSPELFIIRRGLSGPVPRGLM